MTCTVDIYIIDPRGMGYVYVPCYIV